MVSIYEYNYHPVDSHPQNRPTADVSHLIIITTGSPDLPNGISLSKVEKQ
jgi:hypothetical protein